VISLRPLRESDLECICRWRNDPEVSKDLAFPSTTRDRLNRWFAERSEKHHSYVIVVDDLTVGYGQISDIDSSNRKCDIGVVIGEKGYWSRGIGTAVARALTEIAFVELGMHRALAVASERNVPSIRCFKRVGYVEEGRLRHANLRDGEYFDLVLMSVLEHEWVYSGLRAGEAQIYTLAP
jgi:RimJ/RimL family protein N-acetyltransferase